MWQNLPLDIVGHILSFLRLSKEFLQLDKQRQNLLKIIGRQPNNGIFNRTDDGIRKRKQFILQYWKVIKNQWKHMSHLHCSVCMRQHENIWTIKFCPTCGIGQCNTGRRNQFHNNKCCVCLYKKTKNLKYSISVHHIGFSNML